METENTDALSLYLTRLFLPAGQEVLAADLSPENRAWLKGHAPGKAPDELISSNLSGLAEVGFSKLTLFVSALFLGIQFVGVGWSGCDLAHFCFCELALVIAALAGGIQLIGISKGCARQREAECSGD